MKVRAVVLASGLGLAVVSAVAAAPAGAATPCSSAPTVTLTSANGYVSGSVGNPCGTRELVTVSLSVSSNCGTYSSSQSLTFGPRQVIRKSVKVPTGCTGSATLSASDNAGGPTSVTVGF